MDVIIFLGVVLVLAVLFAMFYAGVYLPAKAEEDAARRELSEARVNALKAELDRLTDRDEKGRFVRKEK